MSKLYEAEVVSEQVITTRSSSSERSCAFIYFLRTAIMRLLLYARGAMRFIYVSLKKHAQTDAHTYTSSVNHVYLTDS